MSSNNTAPQDRPNDADAASNDVSNTLVQSQSQSTTSSSFSDNENINDNEEPLESHEVIELQAFIERKAWIDEKIQFLESLPPVEVFAGTDDLDKPLDQITGLAKRAQLDAWLVEHDRIEKETEMFDSGDLRKLKKFTKACTQRNLSPEDTDLIELTLTTLYALDKLLHLLRDRSEILDLLGLRLKWEEQRAIALSTQRMLLDDLNVFLSRARWSPAVYRMQPAGNVLVDSGKPRSSSIGSLFGSDAPEGFSRSARFKLAEELSRDAAQISSKVTALRHGPVVASGKVLDKLIDDSRSPVPEAMLDEQDRLEGRCANDLEAVGKYLMAVVMQWKKADEIYIETKKDQHTAECLVTELEHAGMQHPTRKQDTSLTSRVDALNKRLASRTDPVSPKGTFALPSHPLFPDQADFNASLVKLLSLELSAAVRGAQRATDLASIYHSRCEAVDDASELKRNAGDVLARLSGLSERLSKGFSSDDGDGSPVDLTQLDCVEPMRFSAFLATMPSTVDEMAQGVERATELLKKGRLAALALDKPGINDVFKKGFLESLTQLDAGLADVRRIRDDVIGDTARLREVRRIWSTMADINTSLDGICADAKEAMLRQRWQQQFGSEGLPLTPESPRLALPSCDSEPNIATSQLKRLHRDLSHVVAEPLQSIRIRLPPSLADYLTARADFLSTYLKDAEAMTNIWADLRKQTAAMELVRVEIQGLEMGIEELRMKYDDTAQEVLSGVHHNNEIAIGVGLGDASVALQQQVEELMVSLPTRIPFIARRRTTTRDAAFSDKNATFSSRLPFDPFSVDRVVRSDSNSYAMRLKGGVRELDRKRAFLELCTAVVDVDERLSNVTSQTQICSEQLEDHALALSTAQQSAAQRGDVDVQDRLNVLKDGLCRAGMLLDGVRKQFGGVRESLRHMRSMPGVQDDVACHNIMAARQSSSEKVDIRLRSVSLRLKSLREELLTTERLQEARLREEKAKLEEQARLMEENARLVAQASFAKESARLEAEAAAQAPSTQQDNDGDADLDVGDDTLVPEDDLPSQRDEISEGNMLDGLDGRNGDLFTDSLAASSPVASSPQKKELSEITDLIHSLRQRLRALSLNTFARPRPSQSYTAVTMLPAAEQHQGLSLIFAAIQTEVATLPVAVEDARIQHDIRALREDMSSSVVLLRRIEQLSKLSTTVALCDIAFSGLLDHIDSYPIEPRNNDTPQRIAAPSQLSSEDILSAHVSATKGAVSDMTEQFGIVADDPRAVSEHQRIIRTWEELVEMAMDKINGRPGSRPVSASARSSGRDSSSSSRTTQTADRKRSKFATLSQGARGLLAPAMKQRATSGASSTKSQPRSSLSARTPTTRSVSGPGPQSSSPSSLYRSTFASRQRTTSLSNSSAVLAPKSASPQAQMYRQNSSGEISEALASGSTSSRTSTWAPRQSLSALDRPRTPQNKSTQFKKKYVANPSNKLDVAVGDVVNNLPVNIEIEVVASTWKDQSGKYWIGGSEPKLCFCRILRSQTVMVRVGGGWSELSKFIKDHFADLFRLIPESPPRPGSKDEKWINARILQDVAEDGRSTLTLSPHTPEQFGVLPSFALSSPDCTKTQSVRSASSLGSPLTPLQFIRRADNDPPDFSLSTPTRASSTRMSRRSSVGMSSNPPKFAVWRP